MSTTHSTGATFSSATPSVTITDLTLTDPVVTTEALRWATGARGPAKSATEVDGADLTAYATMAVIIGAQAISAAGGSQDTYNLEQLVQDVGTRTSDSANKVAEVTTKVVGEATKAMQEASADAKKALTEESERSRKVFATSVATARKEFTDEIRELVGGDDPELLVRLKGLVETFGHSLTERADKHSTELFDKATRALDPDDPTSPLAKHQVALGKQHADLTQRLDTQHADLKKCVDELAVAVKVEREAKQASARLASVTTLKGATFEDKVNALMTEVAVGLGDEYLETGRHGGAISGHNKKGDGVLVVAGGPARVVIEMSDSGRNAWSDYLDEAERNRQAQASLGLVPSIEQNGGHGLRALGPRRFVMAFDAENDDPSHLRTAVQLLRFSALAAVARADDGSAQVARERIEEAISTLAKIDTIRTTAGLIRKNAEKVDTTADSVQVSLNRLLLQAQAALTDTALSAVAEVAESTRPGDVA